MVEPHAASRVATEIPASGAELGPHALQILTAEHWSLLASRSMGYTEAMIGHRSSLPRSRAQLSRSRW